MFERPTQVEKGTVNRRGLGDDAHVVQTRLDPIVTNVFLDLVPEANCTNGLTAKVSDWWSPSFKTSQSGHL